eukprot:1671764-Ditylum_brightwellii.AAC.1
MESLDRIANSAGLFANNTIALQGFTTAEETLVDCKDHFGRVICEHSAVNIHSAGVRSSAK